MLLQGGARKKTNVPLLIDAIDEILREENLLGSGMQRKSLQTFLATQYFSLANGQILHDTRALICNLDIFFRKYVLIPLLSLLRKTIISVY